MEQTPVEVIKNNIPAKKKGGKSTFLIILLIILLLASLGGAYYLYIQPCPEAKECILAPCECLCDAGAEFEETNLMGTYTFEYPKGWHVAMLWPQDDYSAAITVAINPTPVNTSPRGGPLAEITFTDKSGMDDPDIYFQERINDTEKYFNSFDKTTIPTDFGEIHHYKGEINLYEETKTTERYLFKIQGSIEDKINTHVIEVNTNPYTNEYSKSLEKLVKSFNRVTN